MSEVKKAARPGRPKGQQSEARQKRILDMAEKLFAENGFHAVTLRQVAAAAKVDTALLHYYFKHKRGLFDSVFQRRSTELNAQRIAALDAYERANAQPSVHGAITAFIQPLKEKADAADPGWRSFFAIVAMINNTPEIGGEIMSENFDPVVHRLLAVIRRVLPDAPDEKLFWAYHCLSGGLTLILSQSGRLDRLSGQRCLSSDMSTAFDELVDFASAGFIATCSAR